jgi:transcription termination/antitermination protein NusA
MNPSEVLRIVDAIHRDKKIDKNIVFDGIEAALISAARKHYGDTDEIAIDIDRETGVICGIHNGTEMTPEDIAERIGAQTAKQVMIQKIREAERDALFDEYNAQLDQIVSGTIHRYDGGAATVSLGNVEAILPRAEQIPGESLHVNQRMRATVCEVRKAGSRVKVILSRTRKHLVARLFEQEIPEVTDGVIEIKAIAREPGNRSKVSVSSSDGRVDCVGACVGVRGNRIKNIIEELSGERIDIVPHDPDMLAYIPNALAPAEVEEVILCQMFGRAIVLVREDQLSLAIGRRGQNVRLASKLVIWDIEIMTRDELDEQIEGAIMGFSEIDGMADELAESLVGEGFLSYDDLSVIEPDVLAEMGGLTEKQVEHIVNQAEEKALEAEHEAARQRRAEKEKKANPPKPVEEPSQSEPAEAETTQAEPEVEAESEVETESIVETEPVVEAESEVETESIVETEPVVETESEVEAEPQPQEPSDDVKKEPED